MNFVIDFYSFWHPTWAAFGSQDVARAAQERPKRRQKEGKKHGFLRILGGTPSGVVFGWIFDDFGEDFGMIFEGF